MMSCDASGSEIFRGSVNGLCDWKDKFFVSRSLMRLDSPIVKSKSLGVISK